jgi:hypothetical protein
MQNHAHGWGLVGFCGGPLMALLLPWVADKPVLWWIIVVVSTVGFVCGLYLLVPQTWWAKRYRNSVALLMIVVAVSLGIMVIYSSQKGGGDDKNVTSTPSLLDLYATSFVNTYFRIEGFQDINEPEAVGRVNYAVLGNMSSRTKFIIYYVPHSKFTIGLIKSLAGSGKEIVNAVDGTINFNTTNLLDSSSAMLRDFVFSGAIYIFYEDDILNQDQIAGIVSEFKLNGQSLQLRSMEYKIRAWDQIKLGRLPKIPRFEINTNGRLTRIVSRNIN